jgi:hypothetical protein
MGWKNVKEHYRIEHLVQVRDSKIHIGSSYISSLIVIGSTGEIENRHKEPWKTDKELRRYEQEMDSDPAKLKELIESPDTFAKSTTVYTYRDADIIEKQCEELGWPNVTHDGEMMYANRFSTDRSLVIHWALENARCYRQNMLEVVEYNTKNLRDAESRLLKALTHIKALEELQNAGTEQTQ